MTVGDDVRARLKLVHSQQSVIPSNKVRRVFPPPKPAEVEPVDYRTALRAIANRDFCHTNEYEMQQWRAERAGAHPDILEFERVFVKRLRKIDVPVFANEVWRSGEAQDEAFKLGRSKAQAGESPHNYGMAVDIIHSMRGWEMSEMSWKILGHMGEEIAQSKGLKITWGGHWKFWDPAHWELTDWRALAGQGTSPGR